MSETFTAVYERGVLRPLARLPLAEHARVQVRLVSPPARTATTPSERQRVYDALLDAGLIRPQPDIEFGPSIPETELAAAAAALASAGPISELIIAERAEYY
jgi:predicted DNA-binding antitoxin AbrB/MazE fold protein